MVDMWNFWHCLRSFFSLCCDPRFLTWSLCDCHLPGYVIYGDIIAPAKFMVSKLLPSRDFSLWFLGSPQLDFRPVPGFNKIEADLKLSKTLWDTGNQPY